MGPAGVSASPSDSGKGGHGGHGGGEAVARTAGRQTTGAQVVLEGLYALLGLGSVVLFGVRLGFDLDQEFDSLAVIADRVVCLLFFLKAAWDLWKAPNRLRWWKWGWADMVASVPEIEPLRALRALRPIMIVRVMRSTTRSVRGAVALFGVDRTRALVAIVFALIVVSVVAGSFLVLGMESANADANIRTAEAAFLWTVSTLIGAESAGFGNHYPVTVGGRLVALWLVTLSLGLIGSLAGLISAWIEEEPGR